MTISFKFDETVPSPARGHWAEGGRGTTDDLWPTPFLKSIFFDDMIVQDPEHP